MTTITEDTPEGGPEELQWKIDRLIEQVERHTAELERESHAHNSTLQKLHEAQDRYDALTSRLTVGVLRKAGYVVKIKQPEVCDTCGEDYV
jgi:recombinational DNA repair protein (RecF pathway)